MTAPTRDYSFCFGGADGETVHDERTCKCFVDVEKWAIHMKPMYAPAYDYHETYDIEDVARMKADGFRAMGLDCEVVEATNG